MRVLQGPSLVWLNLLLLSATAMAWIFLQGLSHDSVTTGLHITARITLLYFLFAFSASALTQLFPGATIPKLLRKNRRYIGLSAAVSHTVHLAFIVCFFAIIHPGLFTFEDAAGGIVGYVLLLLMTVTSNNPAIKRIGRKTWQTLHTVGMYFLFIGFSLRMIEGSLVAPLTYGPWAVLLGIAYLLRIVAWSAQRIKANEKSLGSTHP